MLNVKIIENQIIKPYTKASFKGDIVHIDSYLPDDFAEPKYYKAYSNFRPSLLNNGYIIKLPDKQNITISLKDAKKYLSDNNGQVRPETIENFKLLFLLTRERLVSELDPDDKIKYPNDNPYQRTMRLFQLSRTDSGFDFSSLDKKHQIIDSIYEVCNKHEYNIDDFCDSVLKLARNSDSTLDYKKLSQLLKIFMPLHLKCPLKEIYNTIERFISKDKKHEIEIINTMKHLNNTYFQMGGEELYFDKLMNLCFRDNGEFDSKRAYIMLEFADFAGNWALFQIINNCEFRSDEKILDFKFESYKNYAIDIIAQYFQEKTDVEGNFKPDTAIEHFFGSKIKGIMFL